MPSITIHLSDHVLAIAQQRASQANEPLPIFCGHQLTDHFLDAPGAIPLETILPRPVHTGSFNVANAFPDFPDGSVAWAQTFIDEVMKLPPPPGFSAITAQRGGRGIKISPNFTFVEYLMSKGGNPGLVVSFYGRPERFRKPSPVAEQGLPSYTRARIKSDEDLKSVLPMIKEAYTLKFGRI